MFYALMVQVGPMFFSSRRYSVHKIKIQEQHN